MPRPMPFNATGATGAGLEILMSLRAKGIQITLRDDGRPAAAPRELLDGDALDTLRRHRDLIIAALGFELAAAVAADDTPESLRGSAVAAQDAAARFRTKGMSILAAHLDMDAQRFLDRAHHLEAAAAGLGGAGGE